MVSRSDFKRVNDYVFEVPTSFRPDMRVPARFYADDALMEGALDDKSLQQLVNTSTLPGIVRYALAMPDIHQGYGFPIGGVIATELPDGVISPGGVGYDINCGVRLAGTHLDYDEVAPYLDNLASALQANCPSGVGQGGEIRLSTRELERLVEKGARWALEEGMATEADLERTEEFGTIDGADASKLSGRALERGRTQVGTLGAGNHFLELDVVDEVFDEKAANRMGLKPGRIVAQIHSGSRGFGHQVCSDYVKRFQKSLKTYNIELPDRELVCAPLSSPEGQDYLAAMRAAANYAFCNRQVLLHLIRRSFEQVLAEKIDNYWVFQIYDIAHNMAKIEEHDLNGRRAKVCVHRKGATRAFGPGSRELPDAYRDIGQPVLVPGSMGTASWVLVGTEGSMSQTFGSTCHGAGRTMSRSQAKRDVWGEDLRDELEQQGVRVRAGSMAGLAEEAPLAYKDVDRVIEVVHNAGIARKVARLKPVAVVKG